MAARLAVANAHEVDWNKKAFDRLVLDQKMKDMIYALVDVQISAGKMEDIITGKGNGLVRTNGSNAGLEVWLTLFLQIILLHGSPGTGKTLTAERSVLRFRLVPPLIESTANEL